MLRQFIVVLLLSSLGNSDPSDIESDIECCHNSPRKNSNNKRIDPEKLKLCNRTEEILEIRSEMKYFSGRFDGIKIKTDQLLTNWTNECTKASYFLSAHLDNIERIIDGTIESLSIFKLMIKRLYANPPYKLE